MLYLYALADAPVDAPLLGMQGETIQFVPIGDVMAAIGVVDAHPEVTADTLAAQDRVVRALHERVAALLPSRFGTGMPDEATLVRTVSPRGREIARRLDVVRGCEQMTLRVLEGAKSARGLSRRSSEATTSRAKADARGAEGAQGAGSPGTRYLQERARAAALPPALTTLIAAAASLQRGARVESGRHEGVIGTIYHLITRGRADQYREVIERAAKDLVDTRVVISGPSPAYAFAELHDLA